MAPHNVTVHDLVLEVQSAIIELEIFKTNIGESRIIDQAIKIEIRNQRTNELLHCLTYLMRQLICLYLMLWNIFLLAFSLVILKTNLYPTQLLA